MKTGTGAAPDPPGAREDALSRIDRAAVRDLVNAYRVRFLDRTALRFSIPVLIAVQLTDLRGARTGS